MSSNVQNNLSLLYTALTQYNGYDDISYSSLITLTTFLTFGCLVLGIRMNQAKMTTILTTQTNLIFPLKPFLKSIHSLMAFIIASYCKTRFTQSFLFKSASRNGTFLYTLTKKGGLRSIRGPAPFKQIYTRTYACILLHALGLVVLYRYVLCTSRFFTQECVNCTDIGAN